MGKDIEASETSVITVEAVRIRERLTARQRVLSVSRKVADRFGARTRRLHKEVCRQHELATEAAFAAQKSQDPADLKVAKGMVRELEKTFKQYEKVRAKGE